ncbi:CLUMA_CG007274, isoform A [Clunio marinus]|uniref:CLUMA_CG007274, isoform A n=1 Tax=Clunio marinus TaxID=568069 RepID=A0A1J1I1W3_9DIPT|nr:CLUMA_CG007274, isoform A [Clunio marinus]
MVQRKELKIKKESFSKHSMQNRFSLSFSLFAFYCNHHFPQENVMLKKRQLFDTAQHHVALNVNLISRCLYNFTFQQEYRV